MAAAKPESNSAGGEAILLVEDNDDDVLITSLALKQSKQSYPLRVVEDGAEAVMYLSGDDKFADRAKFPVPRLVLLDLNTPRMSGFKFLEWVRSQASLQGMLVVVFSGSNSEADLAKAKRMGADRYLVKPANFDEWVKLLGTTVSYWMSMHQNAGARKTARSASKTERK